MLEQQPISSRAFCKVGSLILFPFFLLAAGVPATGAIPSASKGAVKPKAKVAEVLDLPNGHVGQRYETKILGVKGIDVGDASCSVAPELPAGLELNCAKMTISGRPEDAVEDAPVHITVSDTSGDSVTIDFNLTVIDGADVVRIGGGKAVAPAAAVVPAATKKPVGSRAASVAKAVPAEPATPLGARETKLAPAPVARVERVAAASLERRAVNPALAPPAAPKAAPPPGVLEPATVSDAAELDGASPSTSQLVAPLITSDVSVDATVVSGTGMVSTDAAKINIALISDDAYEDKDDRNNGGLVTGCLTAEQVQVASERFLPLAQTSGGAFSPTDDKGNFSVTLKSPLVEGQRFHVVQILPATASTDGLSPEKPVCGTKVRVAKSALDWGRIHADFAAGVLISNDSTNSTTGSGTAGSGSFSQAHQFYALSVEKSWSLPGCYIRVFSHGQRNVDENGVHTPGAAGRDKPEYPSDKCYDWKTGELQNAKKWQHLWPGFNTYFQARLTAIPVTTLATKTSDGTGDTTDPLKNIISTAQTAKVEVGTYLPFFVTRWEYNNRPNALFIAPLAKVGFDTVTGPSTATTILPDKTIATQTFEQVYNYWSYGARIGHMELSRSESKAPETFSYLDIAFGPYSSLQSYICKPRPTGNAAATTSTTCGIYPEITDPVESRKRLYRFDIEGLLKIPRTAFYVGLNANIGQRTLGATHLDPGFAAPDDLRFFFGTKFDIASVLAKYNLGTH